MLKVVGCLFFVVERYICICVLLTCVIYKTSVYVLFVV